MATELEVAASQPSETSSGPDMEIMFEDLLVTNEGHWVEAHRPNLLQMWNLLKQGRSRFDDNYLSGCNFRIFCSFVYRWTEDADSDEDSEMETGDEDEDEGDETAD